MQDVTVLGAGGKPVLDQADQGPSCLYSFELADGTVAVGALADNEDDAVPPSPPAPRPPVPRPTPTVSTVSTTLARDALSRARWSALGVLQPAGSSCVHPLLCALPAAPLVQLSTAPTHLLAGRPAGLRLLWLWPRTPPAAGAVCAHPPGG